MTQIYLNQKKRPSEVVKVPCDEISEKGAGWLDETANQRWSKEEEMVDSWKKNSDMEKVADMSRQSKMTSPQRPAATKEDVLLSPQRPAAARLSTEREEVGMAIPSFSSESETNNFLKEVDKILQDNFISSLDKAVSILRDKVLGLAEMEWKLSDGKNILASMILGRNDVDLDTIGIKVNQLRDLEKDICKLKHEVWVKAMEVNSIFTTCGLNPPIRF